MVELVLADGSERTIDGGDELRAARVSLGALGVIAAVTIRCVPAFRLRNIDQPEPLDDVLDDLQERADAHDHFEFWTFPHADVALTRTHERTEDPPRRPGRLSAYTSDVLLDNHAFRAVNEVARAVPVHDPAPEPLRLRGRRPARARRLVLRDLRQPAARALRGDGVRAPARARGRGRPRGAGGARAPPGELPDRAALQRRPTTRCSRPRTSATSTFVAVHVFRSMAFEAAFREVEAALGELGGRPHWGKRSFLSRGRARRATRAGTPSRRSAASLDPDGRFANAWVRDVLG